MYLFVSKRPSGYLTCKTILQQAGTKDPLRLSTAALSSTCAKLNSIHLPNFKAPLLSPSLTAARNSRSLVRHVKTTSFRSSG